MSISRQQWYEQGLEIASEFYDEFTAVRLANEYADLMMVLPSGKIEAVNKAQKNLGRLLGIDEVEIKRKQVEIANLMKGQP